MKSQWYGEIKKANNENAIVAIVANKNDLNEKREVNDEDGKAFAEEKGAFFISTSAKNGNGIQALFKNVIKKIFDPNYDFKEHEKEKEEEEKIEVISDEKEGGKNKGEERVKLKDEKNMITDGKKSKKCKCC